MSIKPRYISSIIPKSRDTIEAFSAKTKGIKYIKGDDGPIPDFGNQIFEIQEEKAYLSARPHIESAPNVRKNINPLNDTNVEKTSSTSKSIFDSNKFEKSNKNDSSQDFSSPERSFKQDDFIRSKFKVEVEECYGKFVDLILFRGCRTRISRWETREPKYVAGALW